MLKNKDAMLRYAMLCYRYAKMQTLSVTQQAIYSTKIEKNAKDGTQQHPHHAASVNPASSNSLMYFTKAFLCTNPAYCPSLSTHIYLSPNLTKH